MFESTLAPFAVVPGGSVATDLDVSNQKLGLIWRLDAESFIRKRMVVMWNVIAKLEPAEDYICINVTTKPRVEEFCLVWNTCSCHVLRTKHNEFAYSCTRRTHVATNNDHKVATDGCNQQ